MLHFQFIRREPPINKFLFGKLCQADKGIYLLLPRLFFTMVFNHVGYNRCLKQRISVDPIRNTGPCATCYTSLVYLPIVQEIAVGMNQTVIMKGHHRSEERRVGKEGIT